MQKKPFNRGLSSLLKGGKKNSLKTLRKERLK